MQGFSVRNIFLLVLGGSLTGLINTQAGGGSFFKPSAMLLMFQ